MRRCGNWSPPSPPSRTTRLSSGVGRDHPGVRTDPRPCPEPHRIGRAGAGRPPGPHRSHRRRRDHDRGADRYRAEARRSGQCAAVVGAEDLRRRVGAERGAAGRRGGRRHLAGVGRIRFRDNRTRGGSHDAAQLADSANDHRGAGGRVRGGARPSPTPATIRTSRRWASSSCWRSARSTAPTQTARCAAPRT